MSPSIESVMEEIDSAIKFEHPKEKTITVRELIKKDFGVDLPIKGGNGNSIDNPVIIEYVVPNDYVSVEYAYLKYLCIGRKLPEWKVIKQSLMEHNGRKIDQLKFQYPEWENGQKFTVTENYYFDITECFGKDLFSSKPDENELDEKQETVKTKPNSINKKLTYNSTFDEVGWSLRDTLDEIKQKGETKQLKFDMLLKYGRIKLMEGNANEAYQIFQQCSIHAVDNGIPDVKELYYWASRSTEEQGNKERALNGYLMLLENEQNIKDEDFVNAVLDRLILFGDITTLVDEYKKRRHEEMTNPKDLLGKVLKFLRENK